MSFIIKVICRSILYKAEGKIILPTVEESRRNNIAQPDLFTFDLEFFIENGKIISRLNGIEINTPGIDFLEGNGEIRTCPCFSHGIP